MERYRLRRRFCHLVIFFVFLTCCYLFFKLFRRTPSSYPAGQVLPLYGPNTEAHPGNCIFDDDFSKNLKKLDSLSFKHSEQWYSKLRFTAEPPTVENGSLPVIVTGANSHYYEKSQAFILSFHEVLLPKYPTLKLVYYDLGLTNHQHYMIQKYCKCEVRKLQFDQLPNHMSNLKNYAFKPLIVKWLYQEHGYVWWFDSAFIFRSPQLDASFQYPHIHNVWFWDWVSNRTYELLARTSLETFNYFKEDPCNFIPFCEIQGSSVAFKTSPVANVVLRQWVSCALDKDCIAPPGSTINCGPIPDIFTEADIGNCQRYDQSILNIMFRRLYQFDVPQHNVPDWVLFARNDYDGVRKKFPVTWSDWFHVYPLTILF